MKRIHFIYLLSALLLALIIIKAVTAKDQNGLRKMNLTGYPIILSSMEYNAILCSVDDFGDKAKKAVEDRGSNNCSNELFFCDDRVFLGMTKEEFETLQISQDSIFIDGKAIEAIVVYEFGANNKLISVRARVKDIAAKYTFQSAFANYGSQCIKINNDKGECYESFWFFPTFYACAECRQSKTTYLTVASYEGLNYSNLGRIVRDGGSDDYMFGRNDYEQSHETKKENQQQKRYKYGDSDVYQGSSKQKEDLKAIDEYFGF